MRVRAVGVFFHSSVFYFLFFAVAAGVLTAQEKPEPAKPQAKFLNQKGVTRLAKVTPKLYRGGQPTHEGFEALKKMGVSIVVDMRSGHRSKEKKEVEKMGMQYVHLSWHCPFPREDVLAKFLKITEDNPQKKVFVHCRLGDDRTGMAVAAYRMAEEGWSAEDAMSEMAEFGFTKAHHFICPGLARYEKSFPKRLESSQEFKYLKRNAN